MNATVVISRQPAPEVRIPLEDQMANFGKFSAPSSILSYPATNFKLTFDQNTFSSSGLNYYAVSADCSPLPAWIQFDAHSLSFTGRTPPFESLVQPPQTFDLSLVASDIVGFSASSLKFSIVVGSHKLTTDKPIVTLNATRGTAVSYDGLENGIKLDGKRISPSDLTVTTKDIPSWLSYDDKTGRLQGTPKDGDHAANFTITFRDKFSDNLDVLVVINLATSLFVSTIEDMKIRPGSKFDLDLTKHFKNPTDIAVKVSTSPEKDWLKVDGLKLSGDVPKTSKGSFKLAIDASSKSSSLSEKEVIEVDFLALDGTTTTIPSVSSSAATTTARATATESDIPDDGQTQPGHMSTGEILLATVIPVIFVAVLLMILVCYFRRRRSGQGYLGSKYRPRISPPVLSTMPANFSDPSMREAAAMGAFVHTETEVFKPAKSAFAEESSPISFHRRSSETLGGLSTSEMPQSMMVDAARTTTIRSVSNVNSEDGRQSWITIDGAPGGISQSDRSSQSEVTFPEATRQIFPGADYTPRRDTGLEITLPTLNELPSLQPTPLLSHDSMSLFSQHYMGHQSAITSSSAALPVQDDHQYTTAPLGKWPTGSTDIVDGSEPNWVTLAKSETGRSICEIRKPDAVAVKPTRPWNEADSLNGGKSVTTEVSFASSENWRVIGRLSPTKTERSGKEIVDDISLHPSRPGASREAAQQADHDPSTELASTNKWGDVPSPLASERPAPSMSRFSKMSDVGDEATHMSGGRGFDEAPWIRDQSGKMSDGSFKVFL
ncbi:transmembrane glycoprotein, putative [Metarhizium acridum CQMa 102]|uniref:Transmembrane glycoprotein, putative n=1 Tax=Metarhizium acridum (strain CQMa 102) TaxID=655827 RepID=E9DY78_METAQ|nr:transmembrane glycoprotein, putative [Metarhizium acridum CQMa 102]EFY91413.1 transmembrane glycoprotein, putative [Metarhizium acridum CQMa 102]